MSSIQQNLLSELALQRQLDNYYYRAAKNADFNEFKEEDYLTIRDIIDSQLKRIELLINPSEQTLNRVKNEIRLKLINLKYIKDNYKKSKLKQWAIDFVSNGERFEPAVNSSQVEYIIKNLLIRYDWDIKILLPRLVTFVKNNLKFLSFYNINRIINKLSFLVKKTKLTDESKKQIDEFFQLISRPNTIIKKDSNNANEVNSIYNMEAFEYSKGTNQYLTLIADSILKLLPNMDRQTIDQLRILAQLIEKFKPNIDDKSFTDALNGLKYKSNTPVTEEILQNLTKILIETKPRLKGKNLAEGLYGLNKFYVSPVTERLLAALAERINETKPILENKEIGMTLFGLQNFSTSKGTDEFINSVADCLNYSKEKISDATVGSTLMGFQNMSPSPATNKFLHRFTDLVYTSKPRLCIHTITSALHGLINFKNVSYSQKLLDFIIAEFKTYKDAKLNWLDMITLVQALNLWGVPLPKWLLEKYQKFINGEKEKPNKWELKAKEYINKRYPFLNVEINYYISGFECDLYIHGYAINIELDGSHHQNKKMRNAKRDRYINSIGCRVFRIDLNSNNMERKLDGILEQM